MKQYMSRRGKQKGLILKLDFEKAYDKDESFFRRSGVSG
jgi:hypothetical protein